MPVQPRLVCVVPSHSLRLSDYDLYALELIIGHLYYNESLDDPYKGPSLTACNRILILVRWRLVFRDKLTLLFPKSLPLILHSHSATQEEPTASQRLPAV